MVLIVPEPRGGVFASVTAVRALYIVTMHPVAQDLPIHPGLAGGILAAAAVQHHRDRQDRLGGNRGLYF